MKDAKGHGSDPHEETDAATRAGLAAHQSYINEVGRAHALGSGLAEKVRMFGSADAGVAHPYLIAKDLREHDPEKLARFVADQVHHLSSGEITTHEFIHSAAHYLHYLMFLGSIAVVTVIAQALGAH
jgi:hypothetical protein